MKFFALILTLLSMTANNAYSWDGAISGRIKGFQVAKGDNYSFRIELEGSPALCGNTHTWAYLNQNEANYQTFVAALLASHMANKHVLVYTNKETSSGNAYCHIGHIGVN